MTQRPLSLIASILGLITVLAVFMPWYGQGVEGQPDFQTWSGFARGYMGMITVAVAALGTGCMIWFAMLRTGPGLSRSLLIVALFGFAAATGLMITDVLREVKSEEVAIRGGAYVADRQLGIYVALASAAGAFLISLLTIIFPKTAHED